MAKLIYEEGMAKLRRLETLINQMDRGGMVDREALKEVARDLYWLLNRWCKEHDARAK